MTRWTERFWEVSCTERKLESEHETPGSNCGQHDLREWKEWEKIGFFFFFFNLGENKTILLGKKGQENGEVMKKAGK